MAYNPTTWGSNDVITKDRLNKMEQGIVSASKLSGTDIDTDKDWGGKNITNVGSLGAASIQTTTYTLAAGSTAPCCYQNNSNVPATKTAPPVPAGRSGSVYVRYNIIETHTSPSTVWLLSLIHICTR